MFSLFNIKGDNLTPILLMAVAAIGGYWLWTQAVKNKADAAAAGSSNANANGNAATLATLRALFTGSNAAPPAQSAQPTYAAPLAGANTAPPGNGSSSGNTPVTQGV